MSAKLPKAPVLYVTVPPPPLIWVYKCLTCRFFQAPDRCAIVSEQGPPDPGVINPESWCLLWLNKDDDLPFSWLSRAGYPRSFVVNGKSFNITYVATSPDDLRTGLGGKTISDTTTMLFVFPQSGYHDFWMDGVAASLDMIWLDSDGRVVHTVKNAPTCALGTCTVYHPAAPANYVLETRAGLVDITVGTVVKFL